MNTIAVDLVAIQNAWPWIQYYGLIASLFVAPMYVDLVFNPKTKAKKAEQ